MFVPVALVLLIIASVAHAQTPSHSAEGATLTAADVQQAVPSFVREQLSRRKIAGAVVVLVKDGVVVVEEGYGLADVAAKRPMQPQTPVRIGSITKLLTALAVMQLADTGSVDLDEDIARYIDVTVPVVPGTAAVTLRRLLSHQTGFEDRIGGIASPADTRVPLGTFLAAHRATQLRLRDDVVAYANINASLAARVVERVSGQSFEEYLAGRIFEPLGMTGATAVQPAPSGLQVASGYVTAEAPPTRVSMAADTILEIGSTGVVASASDMARLLRALLEPNPAIVSRQGLDQMTASQTPVPLGLMGMGMYSPLGAGGNPFIGHDGGTGSFQSVLAILPGEEFGMFAAYNSDGVAQPLSATAELLQFVAGRYFAGQQTSARSIEAVAGTYAPTRGVDSSLFRLRQLLQQLAVEWSAETPSIGPAFLPVKQPLERTDRGTFRWSGRDVAFVDSGEQTLMQIGAPPGMYRLVPWWERSSVIVPVVAVCLATALMTAVRWLVRRLRGKPALRSGAVAPVSARIGLLLQATAWVTALWLVFAGWPDVAWSSRWVPPVTLAIYVFAWTGVLLAGFAVWRLASFARLVESPWAMVRETVLIAMLVVFSFLTVYWRIAGTTLAL